MIVSHRNMKKYTYILFLLFFSFRSLSFAAECKLDQMPSEALKQYKENIETFLREAKTLAAQSTCVKPTWASKYYDVAIPAQSIKWFLGNLESVWYRVDSLISDIRYFFDNNGWLLSSVHQHHNYILEIQTEILKTSQYVASRCAQGIVKFDKDISFTYSSTYTTKDKLLQDAFNEVYEQQSHVMKFFKNLSSNVADREYIDEVYFQIAPKWFAKEMRNFYSSSNIQKCYDNEPKNQKIKEVLKKAFTVGWKYPQAMKIWKEAFELLRYRTSQLLGNTETDATQEAKIKSIVKAQLGWIGNSRFVLNSQFFKEFWRRANNQSTGEIVKEVSKRIAYETFSGIFPRYTRPDVIKEAWQNTIALGQFPTFEDSATWLANIDKSLYTDYARRKALVWQDKAQNPNMAVGLIQSIEYATKMREYSEKALKLACEIYNKQGVNHPERKTCAELAGV